MNPMDIMLSIKTTPDDQAGIVHPLKDCSCGI